MWLAEISMQRVDALTKISRYCRRSMLAAVLPPIAKHGFGAAARAANRASTPAPLQRKTYRLCHTSTIVIRRLHCIVIRRLD
jgi:hypothetical protein